MRPPRSPTILNLIFLGLVLVVLPLIAAIVVTIGQVDHLARTSHADMLVVQEDTATSRALVERATLMERSARQFHVLQDDSYIDLYTEHRDEERIKRGKAGAGPGDQDEVAEADGGVPVRDQGAGIDVTPGQVRPQPGGRGRARAVSTAPCGARSAPSRGPGP